MGTSDAVSIADRTSPSEDDRVYLVPYKWWRGAKEAMTEDSLQGVPYSATSASSYYGIRIINNLLGSDLVLHLRRCYGDTWQHRIGQDHEAGCGRAYALIRSDLWARALKWYGNNSDLVPKNGKSMQIDDDEEENSISSYAYPLTLRISVMQEINMTIKISKKDNATESYKRANKIFGDSEPVHIWDFSGQTNLILMNEMNKMCRNSDQEILLEVQVFAMLGSKSNNEEQLQNPSRSFNFTHRLFSRCEWEAVADVDFNSPGLGLIGLENLGNTCFMNSAVQCLAHTEKLVDYFHGNYTSDINKHNPLGMKGEIALAFGNLLRRLWRSDRRPVSPHNFKSKLSHFAPQFSGFNQHDSQELLAFLLDGLHEDLNRVKSKPYAEAKDSDGRPDDEVADEYWENHLARNDSIIVDSCHGQYKSTLVCPVCTKVSTTFDPFMYLSLPLPCTAKRVMTVTVFSTDGATEPSQCTITVPKSGTFSDFVRILGESCGLRDDEMLLVAEVYKSGILRFLEEPSDLISLLRDDDRLAAYRVPKEQANAPIVVFMHQKLDENVMFGVPLVTRLPDKIDGTTLRTAYLKLINPFLRKKSVSDDGQEDWSSSNLSNCTDSTDSSDASDELCADLDEDLTFVVADDKGQIGQSCQSEKSKVEVELDRIGQTGQSDQTEEFCEIGRDSQSEQADQSNEIGQSDQSEQIDEIVQITQDDQTEENCQTGETSQADQVDQTDENCQTELIKENYQTEQISQADQTDENCQIEQTTQADQANENCQTEQTSQTDQTDGNCETEQTTQTDQTDQTSQSQSQSQSQTDELAVADPPNKRVHVVVQWSVRGLAQCDVSLLSGVPEIYKELPFRRRYRDQESGTLYQCLDTFIKEEPLGPDDMWYCPSCKEHRQASKKLDLWRLPEILVIHLKRFQYNRYTKDKLETFVEFPIHDLDLSAYLAHRGASSATPASSAACASSAEPASSEEAASSVEAASSAYRLYAVSNHYGHLGGGHYTAYVFHEGEKRWYNFDDQFVRPVQEENIKTAAAYVLFYRRIDSTN